MDVSEALQGRGIRRTPQRVAVLRALSGGHALSASEVHTQARDHCPELGLSTVYRTLVALTDAGLLDAIGQHGGEATYRLCSGHHHHHLVCTGCRRVDELADCDLSPIEDHIGRERDFRIDGHSLTFFGLCAACLAVESR